MFLCVCFGFVCVCVCVCVCWVHVCMFVCEGPRTQVAQGFAVVAVAAHFFNLF